MEEVFGRTTHARASPLRRSAPIVFGPPIEIRPASEKPSAPPPMDPLTAIRITALQDKGQDINDGLSFTPPRTLPMVMQQQALRR